MYQKIVVIFVSGISITSCTDSVFYDGPECFPATQSMLERGIQLGCTLVHVGFDTPSGEPNRAPLPPWSEATITASPEVTPDAMVLDTAFYVTVPELTTAATFREVGLAVVKGSENLTITLDNVRASLATGGNADVSCSGGNMCSVVKLDTTHAVLRRTDSAVMHVTTDGKRLQSVTVDGLPMSTVYLQEAKANDVIRMNIATERYVFRSSGGDPTVYLPDELAVMRWLVAENFSGTVGMWRDGRPEVDVDFRAVAAANPG
jgi:hypothetical protein